MPKNWKLIARGLDLDIPEGNLEKLQPALDGLEAAFRPLAETIPHETEPAIRFQCDPEEQS
jgi:hypothetical protein